MRFCILDVNAQKVTARFESLRTERNENCTHGDFFFFLEIFHLATGYKHTVFNDSRTFRSSKDATNHAYVMGKLKNSNHTWERGM